jgi:D-psicose/D-tagatose/L-ribulose 3-epimerase
MIGTDDTGLVDKARALGFDGIEVAVLDRDTFDVAEVRAALQRNAVTPIVSTALPETRDLIHENPDYQRAGQDFLRYCVDVAVALGADRVIGPIVAAPTRLWMADAAQQEREFDRAVQNVRPVADYAAGHGVKLALELLNRFESPFANTAEAGVRLAEAVGNPAFGLLLDTFHMNIEEKDVGAAIRHVGQRLHHFHAIENDRGTPGSGQVDWAGVADGLRDIDYDGWVVIEGFSDKAAWLARAVCMWRAWAPDTTQLASEGLAFLRGTFASRGAL